MFNVLGATGSGWFTDRYNPRLLLAIYYGSRGIFLLCLPWLMASTVDLNLVVFVVGYGLLDLATVPPTITLCLDFYGEETGPVVFDWVNAAHQLGAGATAFLGGVARDMFGSYTVVWVGNGALCVTAVLMSLTINRTPTR